MVRDVTKPATHDLQRGDGRAQQCGGGSGLARVLEIKKHAQPIV